jgi:hypothetical protein
VSSDTVDPATASAADHRHSPVQTGDTAQTEQPSAELPDRQSRKVLN